MNLELLTEFPKLLRALCANATAMCVSCVMTVALSMLKRSIT